MSQVTELELPPGEISSWNDQEYVLDVCPFCGDEKKFVYNIEKTVGRCWVCPRFVTTYKALIRVVNDPSCLSEVDFWKTPTKHTKASSNFLGNAWDHDTSRRFLISRGISEGTSRRENILYEAATNTAFIDIDPISNDLPRSFLWRKLTKDGKWLFKKGTKANYYAWGWQKFINSNKPVLLTEGIFDLITTGLESKGIALLGSAPNYVKFYWLSKNVSRAVVWMDADPAGYKANDYIKEMCDFFHIPCEIVLAKKDPKRYNRRIKSDRLFLEYVESLLV